MSIDADEPVNMDLEDRFGFEQGSAVNHHDIEDSKEPPPNHVSDGCCRYNPPMGKGGVRN